MMASCHQCSHGNDNLLTPALQSGQLEKQGTGNGMGMGTGTGTETGTETGTGTTRAGCYTVDFTSLQTTKLRQATAW